MSKNPKYKNPTTQYCVRLEDSKVNIIKRLYNEDSITRIIDNLLNEKISANISKPSKIKSPIIRIGGKSLIASKIVDIMPKHKFYVDVFGGAGHILLAKPIEMSSAEIFNDKSNDVANMFTIIKNSALELRERLLQMPCSRDYYKRLLKTEKSSDAVERAANFIYIVRNSYYGDGRTGWRASTKNNVVRAYKKIADEIYWISERLKYTQIDNRDWKYIVNRYDDEDNLLYIDPPYIVENKNNEYYDNPFSLKDHVELSERLHNAKAKVMVSHYENEFYETHYKDWYKYQIYTYKPSGTIVDGKKPRVVENIYCNFDYTKNR